MKGKIIFLWVMVVGVFALVVFYIGFVKVYLDEEVRVVFFIKKIPTIQMEFYDPFANEGDNFSAGDLSVEEREQFYIYCKSRLGFVVDGVNSLDYCKKSIPPYIN